MEFPTIINWNSPFLFEGLLGGIFIHIFIEHSVANSGDHNHTPHNAASDLGLQYLP